MSAYAALTQAGYRAYTRDRTTLFFTFAFPLLFLVVFGLIFRGQNVEESGRPYISYIAPGVLSWGVGNAAVFGVAFVLMQWRRDDLLRLIRMTPTPSRRSSPPATSSRSSSAPCRRRCSSPSRCCPSSGSAWPAAGRGRCRSSCSASRPSS